MKMKPTTRLLSSIVFLALGSFLQAMPEIIAHRGASHVAPENTVAAFKEAWKEGADGTELDVYLTKDGRIVTMHDKTTLRTTGVDRPVEGQTLEELKKQEAGAWKGERWKGEPIPTLEESLAAIPDGKVVYIELKSDAKILPELKRVLDETTKSREEIVIIDFNFDSLVKARPMFPDIRLLWLDGGKTNPKTKERVYPPMSELAGKAIDAGFEGLDLNQGFPFDEVSVKMIKDKGLTLAVWTVNEPETAVRLAKLGIDSITTDKPELIRAALKEAGF